MLRRLLHSFASLLVVLALGMPTAQAQPPSQPPAETEKSERSSSALPYAIAILYTILILTIVCVPSRKA